METIYKTDNGELIHGNNVEVMKTLKDNSVDSCVSDFPYNLSFMSKKWDTTTNFYNWCKDRAEPLYRIIKPGGYVLIFGHPKTNHRMKSAFEDVGFNIVEEIDYIYGTGFPKNQDISKLFDKKAGVERPLSEVQRPIGGKNGVYEGQGGNWGETVNIPETDQAKTWDGWKTSGLKPAHEPITVFQKPLEGTYIQNIEKYDCGGMNIDACRIPTSDNLNGGGYSGDIRNASEDSSWQNTDRSEGKGSGFKRGIGEFVQPQGRFPANIILDSDMGEILDSQSGLSKSTGGKGERSALIDNESVYGKYSGKDKGKNAGGLGDSGGASRYFLNVSTEDFVPFYYCAKTSKKEKGEGNTHVTVKPKALIKWLIKLVTPLDGTTIDITSGSGTHGLSCEELNKDENYNLKWINIEMLNTEKDPYCNIAMNRIKEVVNT